MQNFFPEILATLLTHLAVKLAEKQSPALLCLELYLEQNVTLLTSVIATQRKIGQAFHNDHGCTCNGITRMHMHENARYLDFPADPVANNTTLFNPLRINIALMQRVICHFFR